MPYNAIFIAELKYAVSAKRRAYNPDQHEWFIEHGVLPTVVRLVRQHFNNVEVGYDGHFNVKEPPGWGQERRKPPEQRAWEGWREDTHRAKQWSESPSRAHVVVSSEYSVLGVSMDARWEDVQSAYKRLALKHHPDRGGSVTKMQEINQAYNALKKRFGR